MTFRLLVCICCFSSLLAHGQTNYDSMAIRQLVDNVFLSLTTADSALFRRQFVKDPFLGSASNKKDFGGIIEKDSFHDFTNAVGTPRKQRWIEEYWNFDIKIDGVFAQAWCDYAFYVDKRFSHCGIDAFQFIKTSDGWRIHSLIDTRRKEACIVPQEIAMKYQ